MVFLNVTKKERKIMTNKQPDVYPNGRYTPKETAKLLGISVSTIYRYIKANAIKAMVRPSGGLVFTGKEITRFWGGEYC